MLVYLAHITYWLVVCLAARTAIVIWEALSVVCAMTRTDSVSVDLESLVVPVTSKSVCIYLCRQLW